MINVNENTIFRFAHRAIQLSIFVLILILVYIFYKDKFLVPVNVQGYLSIYYVIILVVILCFSVVLKLRASIQINFAIIMFSLALVLYLIEAFLVFNMTNSNIKLAEQYKVKFDTRSKDEVIRDLRSQGHNAFPAVFPAFFLKEGLVTKQRVIYPLSSLSSGVSVYCNESGKFSVFPNDEYGFNNPKGLYRDDIDIMIVGDSFARGACVDIDKTVAGNFRNIYGLNAVSMANGGGPLIELATISEYLKRVKPKVLLWFYYEGNDDINLDEEKDLTVLQKYLSGDFSQNLVDRQKEIDNAVIKYIEESQKLHNKQKKSLIPEAFVNFLFLNNIRFLIINIFYERETNAMNIDLFERVLKKAKKISGNTKMYFVYIPTWQRNAYNMSEDFRSRRLVLNLVKSLDIEIIDFQKTLEKYRDPPKFYTFRSQNHFSISGYRLLSDSIMFSIGDLFRNKTTSQ